MNIEAIVQLFNTPTCIILAVGLVCKVCGFEFNRLHISSEKLEIEAKPKKNPEKKEHKK